MLVVTRGGGGKIPLVPTTIERSDDDTLVFRNWKGDRTIYPLR